MSDISNPSIEASKSQRLLSSKALQLAAAFVLGVVMLFMVGFAPMQVAHNAAHDSRHSHAFPCH